MRALVCGSRDWHRADLVRAKLATLPRGTTILHGGARGADTIAATVARSLGFDVVEYPAEWRRLGRSAGIRRNLAMLDERPDLVVAFHLRGSRGTQHVIDEATRRGIPVDVIGDGGMSDSGRPSTHTGASGAPSMAPDPLHAEPAGERGGVYTGSRGGA
jgi:hypothetical protein